MRKFVLRDGGGYACGVLVLDPQMRNGAVEGYGTSVSRFGDGAFNGAFGFCVVEASRQLALTGSSARTLDIGLAPFAPVRSALPLGHLLLGLQVGGIVPGKGGDRRYL